MEISLNHRQDSLYNRKEVLDSISKRLNNLNKYYFITNSKVYKVRNENQYNFYIYDLVDTLNVYPNKNAIYISFENNHIYHIGSLNTYHNISIILILYNNNLYFFEGLNCLKKINTIEEVIKWIKTHPTLNLDKESISRVEKYKQYQLSYSMDPVGKIPQCECQR